MQTGIKLKRGISRGIWMGVISALLIDLIETIMNLFGGSIVTVSQYLTFLGLYIIAGALCGCFLGLLVEFVIGICNRNQRWLDEERFYISAFIIGTVLLYGFPNIYNPASLTGETVFFILSVLFLALFYYSFSEKRITFAWTFTELALVIVLFMIGGSFLFKKVLEKYAFIRTGSFIFFPLIGLIADRALYQFTAKKSAFIRNKPFLKPFTTVVMVLLIGFTLRQPADRKPLQRFYNPTPEQVAQIEGKPSVILISLDTTRADHLSVYGYGQKTTPNLEKFAKDAILYRDTISSSPWTLPAHASMLTGMYPTRHGAHLAGRELDPKDIRGRGFQAYPLSTDLNTLPEILGQEGYHTAAIVANFTYLSRRFGLAQGFNYYEDLPKILLIYKPLIVSVVRKLKADFFLEPCRSAQEINESIFAWLEVNHGTPFFLFINYMEPHRPYLRRPLIKEGWFPRLYTYIDLYADDVKEFSRQEREYLVTQYDSEISFMDYHLGKLLDKLKQLEIYDNSMIIVTADHGELLGEHNLIGHIGRMLYQEVLRVPLLIKYPHSAKRGIIEERVQLVDIMPTILVTLGLVIPDDVQGDVLDDIQHPIIAEQYINKALVDRVGPLYKRELKSVYSGRFKFIRSSNGKNELYDLLADPTEQNNIAFESPQKAADLDRQLQRWLASFNHKQFASDGYSIEVGKETEERLRALGYIQ